MEVVRLGKYKSAVEPFLASEMSDNNREQISVYLNSLWNEMKLDISKSRSIPVDRLNRIADSLLARNPNLAKSSNLIDKIAYHDEYVNGMKYALGIDSEKDLNLIEVADYSEYASNKLKANYNKNKIKNKGSKMKNKAAYLFIQRAVAVYRCLFEPAIGHIRYQHHDGGTRIC